ncbi:Ras-related protein RABF1, partial [Armadillidium nasatum]
MEDNERTNCIPRLETLYKFSRIPLLSQPMNMRISIVGSSCVGKSSLYLRFASQKFRDVHCITYLATQLVNITRVDGDVVRFEVWDNAGQPRFHNYIPHYYEMADGIIIVYDITSKKSFKFAKKLVHKVLEDTENVPVILVGNKIDLEHLRQVATEEGATLATKYGVNFMETSAKNNNNVKKLFESI